MEDNSSHSPYYLNKERKRQGVVREPWPPKSPNLNKLKDNLAAKYSKLRGSKQLRYKLLEEWDWILEEEKVNGVIDSMPRRIETPVSDDEGSNFNF